MRFPFMFILFLAPFFCGTAFAKSSLYYRADGKLIADTSLNISKVQLKKWLAVEDSFTSFLVKTIRYPDYAKEMGLGGKCIFSFKVDDEGKFSDFKMEGDTNSKAFVVMKGAFLNSCAYYLSKLSGMFYEKGFKSPAGKKGTYFMPIDFIALSYQQTVIPPSGYLIVIAPPPIQIDREQFNETMQQFQNNRNILNTQVKSSRQYSFRKRRKLQKAI